MDKERVNKMKRVYQRGKVKPLSSTRKRKSTSKSSAKVEDSKTQDDASMMVAAEVYPTPCATGDTKTPDTSRANNLTDNEKQLIKAEQQQVLEAGETQSSTANTVSVRAVVENEMDKQTPVEQVQTDTAMSKLEVRESGYDNPVFVLESADDPEPNSPAINVIEDDDELLAPDTPTGPHPAPTLTPQHPAPTLTPQHPLPTSPSQWHGLNKLQAAKSLNSSVSITSSHLLSPTDRKRQQSSFDTLSVRPASPAPSQTSHVWSELMRLKGKESQPSQPSTNGDDRNSLSGLSSMVSARLHQLVRAFSSRTRRIKERTAQPPTPSSEASLISRAKSNVGSAVGSDVEVSRRRLDSFIPMESRLSVAASDTQVIPRFCGCGKLKCRIPRNCCRGNPTIDFQSRTYLVWMSLVALAYLYNCISIPLRTAFTVYQPPDSIVYWLAFDYLADAVYIIDIILVKPRLRFIRNGLIVTEFKETRRHYIMKIDFKMDLFALLPLDLFYLVGMKIRPWLRFARMFKLKCYWEFWSRMDQIAKSGHMIRVLKTMVYMLYLIHLETCGYYAVSDFIGIGTDQWVYDGEGTAYIKCFYLSTKTATSIGNNPKPTNVIEYAFMTVYWLSGVFVFALLIGQIQDIFEAANAAKTNYRKTMDATIAYLQSVNVPNELQNKVRSWFTYNWEHQKTLDENALIENLPRKMRVDLAINVHFHTLSKVQLFQDCEKSLLYDLVLKLKPVLYLPMDFICKKGEVGKEMYIVQSGQVEVVAGDGTVLATLKEGSVFGEISLMALAGGNRRTADVRSKGFSTLFILSKSDFEAAMRDYPEAAKLLKRRAKKVLRKNEKRDEQKRIEAEAVIKTREGTPKLLKTVIQVVEVHSQASDTPRLDSGIEQELKDMETEAEKSDTDLQELDGMSDVSEELLRIEQSEEPIDNSRFEAELFSARSASACAAVVEAHSRETSRLSRTSRYSGRQAMKVEKTVTPDYKRSTPASSASRTLSTNKTVLKEIKDTNEQSLSSIIKEMDELLDKPEVPDKTISKAEVKAKATNSSSKSTEECTDLRNLDLEELIPIKPLYSRSNSKTQESEPQPKRASLISSNTDVINAYMGRLSDVDESELRSITDRRSGLSQWSSASALSLSVRPASVVSISSDMQLMAIVQSQEKLFRDATFHDEAEV